MSTQSQDDFDYEPVEDADDEFTCPKCNGSGREWEGWECYYCEGYGYLDI